jgi:uncharacterized protein with PIN domain
LLAVEHETTALEISIERCPYCRTKLLARLPGEVVLTRPLLRLDESTRRLSARCAGCRSWVELPLRYTD